MAADRLWICPVCSILHDGKCPIGYDPNAGDRVFAPTPADPAPPGTVCGGCGSTEAGVHEVACPSYVPPEAGPAAPPLVGEADAELVKQLRARAKEHDEGDRRYTAAWLRDAASRIEALTAALSHARAAWFTGAARLRTALEQIARMGRVFDAKGTQSARVHKIASEALALTPESASDPFLEGLKRARRIVENEVVGFPPDPRNQSGRDALAKLEAEISRLAREGSDV